MVASSDEHPALALLVDRDAETRQMYAAFLRLEKYEIEEASDGREALARALSHPHDIIVTETRLPGIDGYQLCELLRRDAATQAVPIVFVTGDAYAADMERAKRAGANAILVKPCPPETLVAEIRRAIHESQVVIERVHATQYEMKSRLSRTEQTMEQSWEKLKRARSRTFDRHDTIAPPVHPPELLCPVCDRPLGYLRSHIGGVNASNPEQWDYFECRGGCGHFQYRSRTRKLRKV